MSNLAKASFVERALGLAHILDGTWMLERDGLCDENGPDPYPYTQWRQVPHDLKVLERVVVVETARWHHIAVWYPRLSPTVAPQAPGWFTVQLVKERFMGVTQFAVALLPPLVEASKPEGRVDLWRLLNPNEHDNRIGSFAPVPRFTHPMHALEPLP